MYLSINNNNEVVATSDTFFEIVGNTTVKKNISYSPLGKKIKDINLKPNMSELKIAIICNWNDKCGIATYTEFLVDALKNKVSKIKLFAEDFGQEATDQVLPCWKRGQSMTGAVNEIKKWQPDLILVQHEFGIFPKATYFLQMLQMISDIPYVITLHSVYEHLDKTVCTSAIKNIIVHSDAGKGLLEKLGNNNKIYVVPHGCKVFENTEELWNIFQTPYAIVQFGFGFYYKGVDRALDAIAYLKSSDSKFKEIFYCYLCSGNDHTNAVHNNYYNFLTKKAQDLDLSDNFVIIKGYHSEEIINNYLRTSKLALFPYMVDPNNTVYGASGAIRIAMANNIPVIASESHLFDDLEGILPRPNDSMSLAKEIDKIFSDYKYRNNILAKSKKFIYENSWDSVADKYLTVFEKVISETNSTTIFV